MKIKIRFEKLKSTVAIINTATAGIVELRQACSAFAHSPQAQPAPERFMILLGTSQHITAAIEENNDETAENFLKKDDSEKISTRTPMTVIKIPL